MKYFLLRSEAKYTNMPMVSKIPDEINMQDIVHGRLHNFPKIAILPIHENANTNFIDCISSPFLLLSDICMSVVKIYEPNTVSKQMVLLDSKSQMMKTYQLPILPRFHCLTQNSKCNLDNSIIEYAQIDLANVGDCSMFHIADVTKTYTVIRLDMLESMLKRHVKGFSVVEIDTVDSNKNKYLEVF